MSRRSKNKFTHPNPKEHTVSDLTPRPTFVQRYPHWLTGGVRKATYEAVSELIQNDNLADVAQLADTIGDVSHAPIMKVLFKEGWLMLDDGKQQSESVWAPATKTERDAVTVLPPTQIVRNKRATGARYRKEAVVTTTEHRMTEEIEVSGAEDSWEIDLVGRENITIEQLQDSLAIAGLVLEIRVKRA